MTEHEPEKSPDPGDVKVDMAALALELVGAFSRLQDYIDQIVGLYVAKRAPALTTLIDALDILNRIGDDQRPRLVLSIADHLGGGGDLSNFLNAYRRVEDVRNFIAHGTYTERSANTLVIHANYVTGPFVKPRGIKKRVSLKVTRSTLNTRLNEAKWLLQHVQYLVRSSGLTKTTVFGGHELKYAEPPGNPSDWDGKMLTDQR